jgi:hypothetical protein
MRFPLLALVTTATLGCAGATGTTTGATTGDIAPTPTVTTTRIVTSGGSTVTAGTMAVDLDVRLLVTGTPDQAWAVLPTVYQQLGIPAEVNDPRGRTMGVANWRVRRLIGKTRATQYVDCGSSGTLQNAETYQLTLSILSSVRPNPKGGAIVTTAISGTGRNPITSSNADVRCVSTGDLELKIRELVEAAIHAK